MAPRWRSNWPFLLPVGFVIMMLCFCVLTNIYIYHKPIALAIRNAFEGVILGEIVLRYMLRRL